MPEPIAPARPRHLATAGCAVAEAILHDMRSTGRPVGPRHFEFWFNYKAGRNTALNAAVDELIARHGNISAEQVEKLHARHLSPWRLSDGCEAVTGRLADRLQELSASLEEAIGSSSAQRENLMAEACELSIGGGVTLQRAIQSIDRLMQSASDCKTRHAILGAKLDAAKREIGALQAQLDVVRAESQAEPLTALMSRSSFDRALAKAADRAERDREPLALILADLDYFADFNETFGRDTSDQVLRAVGLLMRTHMRSADLVARFGGDQLAAILPNAGIDEAVKLADRFRQVLMTNELAKGPTGNVSGRLTVSIGAAGHQTGDSAEALLERARSGLDVAKKEGRNRVVQMNPDGRVWTAARVA